MFRDFLPPRDSAHNNSPKQRHGSPLATRALLSDTLLSTKFHSTNRIRTRLPLVEFILLRPLYVTDLSRAAPCISVFCSRDHTTSKLRIDSSSPDPATRASNLFPSTCRFEVIMGLHRRPLIGDKMFDCPCRTSRHWSHNPSVVR